MLSGQRSIRVQLSSFQFNYQHEETQVVSVREEPWSQFIGNYLLLRVGSINAALDVT